MAKHPIPPLSALRGFEAAARYSNFSRAASELNVTQSAISHQVGQIERLWKLSLFERRMGHVVLTAAGQALAPVIRQFLMQLEDTLDNLSGEARGSVLRANVHNSFAVTWLLPRLPAFYRRHPKVRVWLSTNEFSGFDAMDVDIAIRLGIGDWKGVYQELLLKEYLFPVCSPELLQRYSRPQRPSDLLSLPLIVRHRAELDGRKVPPPSWRDWFAENGVENAAIPDSMVFPHTSMAIQAAIDGQGVALARSAHISDQIERGQLVKLFTNAVPSASGYWILCREGRQNEGPIRTFRQWLKRRAAEAQKDYEAQAAGNAIREWPLV
jgi:LysR family glycine cleavage system transcriptional activator